MFASLSRFRRLTAVLSALALMASVLAAAPLAAADDPERSNPAAFDACEGVGSAGFEDVSDNHVSAGSINCIAYYGITKGTGDGTTYSPSMSVTREQMALFLTRLAEVVGIEMASNPPDAGFTDIGELGSESQTAINQLADLDITMGTGDGTTYSPAGSVTRGQMALFIARLMDEMTAVSDGDAGNGAEGSLPKDVEDGKTPFTDLGRTTKEAYDAITALWELGVASGISDTSYAPSASITRSAMAEFMAGVLDHSNARPAGLSIQVSNDSGFGVATAVLMVSYRDDDFAPVEDVLVDVFSSVFGVDAFDDNGNCVAAIVMGDCQWNTSDEPTDGNGNIFDGASATQVDAEVSSTRVYYAWIGDDETNTFDMDDVDPAMASLTVYTEEAAVKVDSDVNDLARSTVADGPEVHLGRTDSVTYTVQLRTADDGHDVARSGIMFTVTVSKGAPPTSVVTTTYETDENGQITFSVDGPDDDPDNDPDPGDSNASDDDRKDTITITYHGGNTTAISASFTEKINWREASSEVVTATAKAGSSYVIVEADGDATVSASVMFYDQYGAPHRQARGQTAGINYVGDPPAEDDGDPFGTNNGFASVRSNGTASRGATLKGQQAGIPIAVTFISNPTEAPNDIALTGFTQQSEDPVANGATIQVVREADSGSTGPKNIHTLYGDENKFTVEKSAGEDAELLYSYDSGDTFTDSSGKITMEKFEELLANPATGTNNSAIDVVIYNPDGDSIFQVTS